MSLKYSRPTGEWKTIVKTKKYLKNELKQKGYVVRGHVSKEKIEQLAKEYSIDLTCRVEVVEEGWLGKPKGLLHVLWERGQINDSRLGEYLLKGQEIKKTKKERFYYNTSILISVPS